MCLTTVGSPLSDDCASVAEYLLGLGDDDIQCGRNKTYPGNGNCQKLWSVGTCIASICGPLGNAVSCTDAGNDVSTLATICASGSPGNTSSAGSLIPYGNGNLRIQISNSAGNPSG